MKRRLGLELTSQQASTVLALWPCAVIDGESVGLAVDLFCSAFVCRSDSIGVIDSGLSNEVEFRSRRVHASSI